MVKKDIYITTFLKLFTVLVFAILSTVKVQAQQEADNPRGVFLEQQIKVGEPIHYILTYQHPADMEVLFPDSTYNFAPFEWISQDAFATKTDSTGSFDSVVYTLMTFELDSIQTLSVPIWEVTGEKQEDRKNIFPLEDRILLEQTVAAQPDSLTLQTNTSFLPVLKAFNYPYLLVAIGVLIFLGVIIIVVFGKPIRKAYRLRKMKKEYTRFSDDFNKMIEESVSAKLVEQALLKWKNYTAKMVDLPLYSYTTKEITFALSDDKLNNNLIKMDRAIYADMLGDDLGDSLRYLHNYALSAYQQKVKEVKNA